MSQGALNKGIRQGTYLDRVGHATSTSPIVALACSLSGSHGITKCRTLDEASKPLVKAVQQEVATVARDIKNVYPEASLRSESAVGTAGPS